MKRNVFTVIVFAVFLYGVSALCIFGPKDDYSVSERRALAKLPDFNMSTILSGEFATGFENYATDAFPARDTMRSVKAIFATRFFGKKDNNGLFTADGHLSKIDSPVDYKMLSMSADKFKSIAEKYVNDESTSLYFTIVPDKNMYLASKNGYPSMDYEALISTMREKTKFMEYIDITGLLSEDYYYFTDTHWRQEKLAPVAEHIANAMGQDVSAVYDVNTLDVPFNGVYVGQYAMKAAPDTIRYLTNDTLDNAIVTYYDTGMPKKGDMYNMEKAKGHDAYEMFLSGAMPIVSIENPDAQNDRELILFRDSFGSSIAPLFAEGYSKVTLVDIRYVASGMLGGFLDFENADVLFMYSSSLLNNSTALR